ncbi:hypothetical protein, conserved [Babesia bigemina]|uniref:Uncharacterized protein n=1 Tax=Babesia bigemina TaxID=5866 RepID=A0A061D7U9_BABBI|nr:hypothetical protein, conserved [Babesia bigemina]CDR96618.1 hypothetical protein, conserved [Babesia bigemina]|eukprot:XP_012768804.1 hypothetical protein, conserved [Babesia bigemina]
MARLVACVYLFLLPVCVLGSDVASEGNDRDNRLEEFPEAMDASELKRAREVAAKDDEIYMSLEDQAKMLDTIAEELAMMNESSDDISYEDMQLFPPGGWDQGDMMYSSKYRLPRRKQRRSDASIDKMEAPVIYLTPPVELPDEQMEADKEVEKLLMDTGLEDKPHSLPEDDFDPFTLTSMDEVMTAMKKTKSTIDTLREKRTALLKTLRESSMYVATDHSKMLTYKAVNQELDEVDNIIEKETTTLLKLEHVKRTLSRNHGAGRDVENEEAKLEKREEEIAEGYATDADSDAESDKEDNSNDEF